MKSFLLLHLGLALVPLEAAEWPQWRGRDGQGHARGTGLPATWGETNHVTWKTLLPGRGWSSPIIAGKEVWLTTALETPANAGERDRRLKANTGNQPVTTLARAEFRALCVDRDSGRISRNILLHTERDPQWAHELNSYASPTPVFEEDRLYCHFGASGTFCLDTRHDRVLWANTNLVVMHENGPGSTPVLWKDLLIFHLDGSDLQSIAALDKRTGQLSWKTARTGEMNSNPQLRKSYGTPFVLESGGQGVVVSPAPDWLYGYDAATGSELWKLPYGHLGFSIAPRPVAGHGLLYMSTGFMRPEMLAIRLRGRAEPEVAWRYNKGAPTMPSPLLVGDELYFLTDSGGLFTCLDAHTGKEHYRERLGGNYSSSPTFADGKIYVSNREGTTSVVAPGKTFRLLATNGIAGKIFASLAVADNALFLRSDTALYRIEEKRPGAAPTPARQAYDRLRKLEGDWEARISGGGTIKVSHRLLASGSAFVETFTMTGGGETLTVYHLDGPRLLATHYCAQRNQPRLALDEKASGEGALKFEFLDVTNLAKPTSSHLHRLVIEFVDADHFNKHEIYTTAGQDDTTVLRFARVK